LTKVFKKIKLKSGETDMAKKKAKKKKSKVC
jgi:hypothetical protein